MRSGYPTGHRSVDMAEFIARCRAWVRAFLAQDQGRAAPADHRTYIARPWAPPDLPTTRHHQRPEQLIDGDATALVRPYLLLEDPYWIPVAEVV
jgi:hypothetical protein